VNSGAVIPEVFVAAKLLATHIAGGRPNGLTLALHVDGTAQLVPAQAAVMLEGGSAHFTLIVGHFRVGHLVLDQIPLGVEAFPTRWADEIRRLQFTVVFPAGSGMSEHFATLITDIGLLVLVHVHVRLPAI
jgi:hypothetical protein